MSHAQIIDFCQASALRPDPRSGELVERYLACIQEALEADLPEDPAELSEILERSRD